MQRTIATTAADVLREAGGQARPLEAMQGIFDAVKYIDSKGNWEFQIAHANIHLVESYNAGTITATKGSPNVVGLSTLWNSAGMTAPELIVSGHRPLPGSIVNDTAFTLRQNFLGPTLTSVPYTLYQAEYALPTDCEGGRDLVLRGPQGWGSGRGGLITKKSRALFDTFIDMTYSPGQNSRWYTDGDNRGNNSAPMIRLYPYPSTAVELELTYYRTLKFNEATVTPTTVIPLPETFDYAFVALASAFCMRRRKMQGWLSCLQHAQSMIDDLYARHAASSAYEDVIEDEDDLDTGYLHAEGGYLYTGTR